MLRDGWNRDLQYLRLSVTDVCNFRCVYCLPNGYTKSGTEPLSVTEIRALVTAFAELGFWKVRITGGEPTTRPDLREILDTVRVPGIRHVALSTNGYRLRAWPVDSVNVSIDSMDPATFSRITGHDVLPRILAELETMRVPVKINAVLMGEPEEAFFEYVRTRDTTVRFIQPMQVGDLVPLRRELSPLAARLADWSPVARREGAGPAAEYTHPNYRGKIGVIAAYAPGFCDTCNRLRVTSTGKLRLCLFGDGEVDLRPHIFTDVKDVIVAALTTKAAGHRLREGNPGITRNLAETGG